MKPSNLVAPLSLLAAVMIPAVAAHGAATNFALDGGEGATSFTQTVGNLTLIVNNPSGRSTISAPANFIVGGSTSDEMTGFQFHFDAPVLVTGYEIGFGNNRASATISLLGPNGNSTANPVSVAGNFTFSGSFFLGANEIGTLTSVFPLTSGYVQMSSITVTVVPEPGTWSLLAGGVGGLAAIVMRQRRQRHGV